MTNKQITNSYLIPAATLLEQFINKQILNSILHYWLKLKYNSIPPSIHTNQYPQSHAKPTSNHPPHSHAHYHQPSHQPTKNLITYDPSIHHNNFEDIILARLNTIQHSMHQIKNSRQIYSNSQSHQHYPDQTLSRIDQRPTTTYTNNIDSYAELIDERNSLDKNQSLFTPVLNSRHIKIYTQNNQHHQIQQTTSLHFPQTPFKYANTKYNSHTPSHNPKNPITNTNKISTKDWKPRFFKQQSIHLKTLQQKYNIQSSITQSIDEKNHQSTQQQITFSRKINYSNNYLNNNANSQSNYYAWNSPQEQKKIQQPKAKYNTNPQSLNYSFNPKKYSNTYNSKVISPKEYEENIHTNHIPISHLEENISISNQVISKQLQRKNINEKAYSKKIIGQNKKQIKC